MLALAFILLAAPFVALVAPGMIIAGAICCWAVLIYRPEAGR